MEVDNDEEDDDAAEDAMDLDKDSSDGDDEEYMKLVEQVLVDELFQNE